MVKVNVQRLSVLQAVKGLMFATTPRAVYFETRGGIHTFFLKFPIDVVILDKSGRVIELKENLNSWRIFFWNPKYERVVELPAGTISKLKIELNSQVNLRCS